jgi:hypothetical protein
LKGTEDGKIDLFIVLSGGINFMVDLADYCLISGRITMRITMIACGGAVQRFYATDGETCSQETIDEIEAKI